MECCSVSLYKTPDAVHHSNADVLNGSEEVLVGDQIPPDGTAVGAPDVLGQMVQEHGVHPGEGPQWTREEAETYLLYQSSTDWISSSS